MNNTNRCGSFAVVTLLSMMGAAATAWGHHSTAAFDYSKSETLRGTVRGFEWTNPHSYIQLVVNDDHGGAAEWSIECGTPTINMRAGWTKNSLKPGDKVVAVIAPMRDGSQSGTLRMITLPDGKVLKGAAATIQADPSGAPTLGNQLPTLKRATPEPHPNP